jgi:hypothetical protein
MPIRSNIDHKNRIIIATAEEAVTSQELQDLIADIISAGAMPYRKIFDISKARLADPMRASEVAATIRLYDKNKLGPVGPVAIVVDPKSDFSHAKNFVEEAVADRPVQFFQAIGRAQEWLDSLEG